MGILDDAIREHLDLKRSHGASEDEIRRKEAEAFGPPQPEVPAAAPEMPHDEHTQLLTPDERPDAADAGLEPLEAAPEDPYAVHPGEDLVPDPESPHEVHHEHEHEHEPAAEAGAGTLEPSEIETGPPMAPSHHDDEQHPALADHDHIGGEEYAPEPVFGHRPPAPPAEEPPPRQSAERADDDEDDENAEDPLEETPEFLQDAPEHDRLWFEQKPPRDFDFGE
jgi:hypothetical protein